MPDVRLIDANALDMMPDDDGLMNGVLFVLSQRGGGKTLALTRMALKAMIDNAPTIDAVPVVHGRWACDEDFNTVCTACGKLIPTFHCYNEETDEEWDEPIDKTPFCPNCGAKMDGGADNA